MVRILVAHPAVAVACLKGALQADAFIYGVSHRHTELHAVHCGCQSSRLETCHLTNVPRDGVGGCVIFSALVGAHKCVIGVERCGYGHALGCQRAIVAELHGIVHFVILVCVCLVHTHIHFHVGCRFHILWSCQVARADQHAQRAEPAVEILWRAADVSLFRIEFGSRVVAVPHYLTLAVNVSKQFQIF